MKKILASIALLLGAFQLLSAIPAYPGKIRVTQPDGSEITIQVHGDEWFHYTTDLDGRVIARGRDGFFRLAEMPSAAQREEALQMRKAASQARQAAKASSMTQGRHYIPVVLVSFDDLDFVIDNPRQAFSDMLNEEGYSANGGTGSVRDFYVDNSQGAYEPVFEVFGPYRLSGPQANYPNNAAGALKEACKGLNGEIDFSRYDSDNNGEVDMILMYYAGFSQAEGGGEDTIWPHQSWIYRSDKYDGKTLGRYFCTAELKGASGSRMCGIGPTSHEFAHSLGLPDFYDTDYEKNGDAGGLYSFSVMCNGSYNNNGRTPPYLNSEERMMLGWMDGQEEISRQGSLTVRPVQENVAYKTPTSVNGEYFVYECRDKTGWDKYIPGGGLLVYHVDKSSAHSVGGRTAKSLWDNWESTNIINAYGDHPCFYLVPAPQPSSLYYSGYESAIPFPGTKRVQTYLPTDWDGVPSDFKFSNISFSRSEVTLTVSYTTTPGVSGRVMNTSAKPVRGATVRLSPKLSAVTDEGGAYSFTGTDLADGVFDMQVTCDGYVSASATVSVGRGVVTQDFYLRKNGESEEGSFSGYDPSKQTVVFGAAQSSSVAAAIHVTAAQAGAYAGKQIKSISFQLVGDAASTADAAYVFVDVGKSRKLTQKVDNLRFGEMVTVNVVAKEFYVPSGSDLYIGYGLQGCSVDKPVLSQTCSADQVGYYGDYNGTRPVSWQEMSYSGKYYSPVISASVGEKVEPELGFNHIANPGNGTYRVGDRFELALVRYEDDAPSSVSWTFDGQAAQGGSVTLTAGKHTVEAHLRYPDGSAEVIRLIVTAQ